MWHWCWVTVFCGFQSCVQQSSFRSRPLAFLYGSVCYAGNLLAVCWWDSVVWTLCFSAHDEQPVLVELLFTLIFCCCHLVGLNCSPCVWNTSLLKNFLFSKRGPDQIPEVKAPPLFDWLYLPLPVLPYPSLCTSCGTPCHFFLLKYGGKCHLFFVFLEAYSTLNFELNGNWIPFFIFE